VFKLVGKDRWQLVGQADRTPGRTAKVARGQAIHDACRSFVVLDQLDARAVITSGYSEK
jgi:hypothetical protein